MALFFYPFRRVNMLELPSRIKVTCERLGFMILDWLRSCFRARTQDARRVRLQAETAFAISPHPRRITHGRFGESAGAEDISEDRVVDKKALLERLLPRSKSYLVATLQDELSLPNGEVCKLIIVSRYIIFRKDQSIDQMVSLFFAQSLKSEDVSRYEMQMLLDLNADSKWIREIHFEKEGTSLRGKPQRVQQGDEGMSEMEARADAFLRRLEGAVSYGTLPRRHRLLKPMALEFRSSSERG